MQFLFPFFLPNHICHFSDMAKKVTFMQKCPKSIFTLSKEASTKSCAFYCFSTVFLSWIRGRVWKSVLSSCQQMTSSIFFSEKTSLLRFYPGRCVETPKKKMSLDGFNSPKLFFFFFFSTSLISWSTAYRGGGDDSKYSCQSYILEGPGRLRLHMVWEICTSHSCLLLSGLLHQKDYYRNVL